MLVRHVFVHTCLKWAVMHVCMSLRIQVCVGLACFSPFRTTDSGRALSDEQGEQYLDAIRDAEASEVTTASWS